MAVRIAFQVFPVVAWCVCMAAFVLPLRLGRLHTLVAGLAFAAAFAKFAVFALAGGDGFNPELPQGVIWLCGWAYATAVLVTGLSVAAWVVRLPLRLLLRRPAGLRATRILAVASLALAASTSLWGMYEGVAVPAVREKTVFFSNLPQEFDGFRILHLSDLHCSAAARRGRFEAIVSAANASSPDLVAITGDFVDGLVADRLDDLAPLAGLRAPCGVFGCSGNHEAYWDWPGWSAALKGMGIVFPEDDGAVAIRRGNAALAVGAIPDVAVRPLPADAAAGIERCFAGTPRGAFRILLFHRPWTAATGAELPEAGVSLQLSGHTHGGAMPGLASIVARFNEGRVKGLYTLAGGAAVHVSPGTGQWAGFPLRLFNPSEATLLVLRRQ